MTKRIAVITMGTKLGNETKGYTRIPSIARMLAERGYEVDLITSSFQHWEKAQRDTADPSYAQGTEPFDIVFIDEPGYKRNIDPKRLRSHRVAAKNLLAHLENRAATGDAGGKGYDLIYIEIPPNDVALAAGRFASAHGIPFVGDINDLWPEAMRMVCDVPLVSSVLFAPLARDAHEVYSLLDGVVGTSDEYTRRPFLERADARTDTYGEHEGDDDPEDVLLTASLPHATVYVGNEMAAFDSGEVHYIADVTETKGAREFWVTYAGTLGTSYDIRTLILAADELARRATSLPSCAELADIRIKILGGGPEEEGLRALAASHNGAVEFLGYQPYEQMAAFLCASDVLVNSFVKKAPQSIVTKIGDYLAAAKPMINTCSSREFRTKVDTDGFGINIEAEDPRALADAIERLYRDPVLCAEMGSRARTVAEAQFDRPTSYRRIVDVVEELLDREAL